MSENQPPSWNPGAPGPIRPGVISDPAPWPQYPWYWWWCRCPWPPWDPIFLPRLRDKIEPMDLFELHRIQMQAQRDAFNSQVEIQLGALEQQRAILKKYG